MGRIMPRNRYIAAMLVATGVLIALLAFSVHSSSYNDTKELLLVHIVMRHGARTPVDSYPTDPHINESLYPTGWGHLTNDGKLDLYNTGKYLRERYGHFLGDFYNSNEYYVQSTDVDRTKASLQLVNAGLWPPQSVQKWGPLDWQPIPVHSQPLEQDSLLLVRTSCPAYNYEFEKVLNSTEVQDKLKSYKDLFEYVEQHSGLKIRSFFDIQDIYATLLAEYHYNLTLPDWTKGYFPEKMEEPAAFYFKLIGYNEKLKSLKGGVLLKKIMQDWQDKYDNKIKPKQQKAFLYGGHDSTVANLLNALNVFDPQVPAYGATIMLEFSRDKITNQHGIEIFFRNSTSEEPHQLQVPGCDKFCTLSIFTTLLQNNIPQNMAKECIADDPKYLAPPPTRP